MHKVTMKLHKDLAKPGQPDSKTFEFKEEEEAYKFIFKNCLGGYHLTPEQMKEGEMKIIAALHNGGTYDFGHIVTFKLEEAAE